MSEWIEVLKGEPLDDPGTRGIEVEGLSQPGAQLFLVHKDGALFAYRNSCPHTGAPLEWQENQFLDQDNYFIECAMHGALFRVDDGVCLRGPCAGQALQGLPLRVDEHGVWVDITGLRPQADES